MPPKRKRAFVVGFALLFACSALLTRAFVVHANIATAFVDLIESIGVQDNVTLLRGALVSVSESITVRDGVVLLPAAIISIQESIGVSDAVNLDATPPTVTLSAPLPKNPTNSSAATFSFIITDPDNTSGFNAFCSLDGSAFGSCSSPVTLTNLADATHTFTVHATDPAGNRSQDAGYRWMVDTAPPSFQCAPADANWHADDVSLACSASDVGSGLANSADAAFALTTNVPASSETANASTSSRQICDAAGNCVTAGPIAGNMVDKKAPHIAASAISTRDGRPYTSGTWTNQSVQVSFACTDGGSGLDASSVTAPVTLTAEGQGQSVTGSCADNVGNSASRTFGGINIDKTPPSTGFGPQPGPLNGRMLVTVNTNVLVIPGNVSFGGTCYDSYGLSALISGSDSGSGVAAIKYGFARILAGQPLPSPALATTVSGSSASVPFLTTGSFVLNAAAVDQAGNQGATQTQWVFVNAMFGVACATMPVPLSSLPASGTVTVSGTLQIGTVSLPFSFAFSYAGRS
jgi:hypothetical protein